MRNIDEHTLTDAVLQSLAATPDPRLKQVMTSLVTHLHDFVRDVKLTEAEWQAAIAFLTAAGQKCSDTRQEFILLSDTLGVSMLTIALNHAKPAGATEATVFGPFHTGDAPHVEDGADIAHGAPGLPMFVHAVVRGPDGEPVAGAEVDVWQADDDGLYDVQRPELSDAHGALQVARLAQVGRTREPTGLLPDLDNETQGDCVPRALVERPGLLLTGRPSPLGCAGGACSRPRRPVVLARPAGSRSAPQFARAESSRA